MKFNFKKKYWWTKYIWNKGNYTYYLKNWKINKLFKTKKDRNLNISSIIKTFNKHKKLFKCIKYLNIIRKSRNVFLNISSLKGNILKNSSSGMLYKRGSERRTYVAFNDLLENYSPGNFRGLKNNRYIIRVRTNNHSRAGFKRSIKMFLKSGSTKIYKQIAIKFKAHNGVRRRKKKRK